jgi:hypothetical protein
MYQVKEIYIKPLLEEERVEERDESLAEGELLANLFTYRVELEQEAGEVGWD